MASLRTYCERLAPTVAQKENHFRRETSVGFLSNCCDEESRAVRNRWIPGSFSGCRLVRSYIKLQNSSRILQSCVRLLTQNQHRINLRGWHDRITFGTVD